MLVRSPGRHFVTAEAAPGIPAAYRLSPRSRDVTTRADRDLTAGVAVPWGGPAVHREEESTRPCSRDWAESRAAASRTRRRACGVLGHGTGMFTPSPVIAKSYEMLSTTTCWPPGQVSVESGVIAKLTSVRPFLTGNVLSESTVIDSCLFAA